MLEKLNYKINSKMEFSPGTINGQGLEPINKCRYGLFSASYNSCEMIAIYNYLYLNGITGYSFAEICREMYKKAWAFWGILGSNVYKLDKFFINKNIPIKKIYKMDKFFSELESNKTGILSYWNSKNPLRGVHTVCIEKKENKYIVYNRYSAKACPCEYENPNEIIDKTRFMVGYLKSTQPVK